MHHSINESLWQLGKVELLINRCKQLKYLLFQSKTYFSNRPR